MVNALRRPWLAGLFSFLVPGLGQVYNGELKKGIIFFAVSYAILLCSSLGGLQLSFLGLIILILIALGWQIFIIVDAIRTAKEIPVIQLRKYHKWYIYLLIILVVSILDPALTILSIQSYSMSSGSMEPTLLAGDYVITNSSKYGIINPLTKQPIIFRGKPQRGDVVVFTYPPDPSKSYLKRVVGLPGDRLQIVDKRLYLNGQLSEFPVPRDNLEASGPVYRDWQITSTPRDNFGPVQVPDDAYFVMGDNRDNSYDSRFWGFVPRANLRGQALYIYFSKEPQGSRIRWGRIGKTVE